MTKSPPVLDSPAAIRHVIEVAAPEYARTYHSLYSFLIDETDRGIACVPIEGAPRFVEPADAERTVGGLAHAIPAGGGLLLLVGRPRPSMVTDSDRNWFRALRQVCSEQGVRPLGVWLATPGYLREITVDDLS